MTPIRKHPSPEEWIDWFRAGSDETSKLARHLASCEACRRATETLGELHRARKATWKLPSQALTRRAQKWRGQPAPPVARHLREVYFAPVDVRSGAPSATGEPRTLTGSTHGVRVGLIAVPRPANRRWVIRGIVWLEGATEVRVLLAHDDHVLAEAHLTRSGEFSFDEPSPPGWTIEVHPPGATPLLIRDPEAS